MTTGTQDRNETGDSANAGIRDRAAEAYAAARERTSAAYASAREGVTRAGQRTSEGIEASPMAAVVGGLALGAIAAVVLPLTRREGELLGGTGRKVTDAARGAAQAAREAGLSKLDELGLSREAAQQRIAELAQSASSAAADAMRGQGRERG